MRFPMTWFHASDHELPIGTRLIPGGGTSLYEDWYGEIDEPQRADCVWVEPELARITAAWAGPSTHVYQVIPESEPTSRGQDGWTTSAATIVAYVGIGRNLGVEMST